MTDLTEREVFFLGLKALGGMSQGGLKGQLDAIQDLQTLLANKRIEVANKYRVELAQQTADKRVPRDHDEWGVHMRHCYGLDYDSCWDNEEPTTRHSCKYGEDDICPAALHEDPWAVYCEAFPDN